MLRDHLDVCREEDDSSHGIELKAFSHYDSDNSEEFEDSDSEAVNSRVDGVSACFDAALQLFIYFSYFIQVEPFIQNNSQF